MMPLTFPHLRTADAPPPAVIVLACPRSYSSLFSAMLGQHPELYGVPELKLFTARKVSMLIRQYSMVRVFKLDGLIRTIAQVEFQEQSEEAVEQAWSWLRDRRGWTTEQVWNHLAGEIAPLRVVDKSPMTAAYPRFLNRSKDYCPDAQYIYLTRHPRPTCKSINTALRWVNKRYGTFVCSFVDPELIWLKTHRNILRFLSTVPPEKVLQVKGEDFVANASSELKTVAEFLGISTAPDAMDDMLHPERSVYSKPGPQNARLGTDPNFLDNPIYTPHDPGMASLEGHIEWPSLLRRRFRPETISIARQLGYE